MTGEPKRGDAAADKWRETFEKNRKESDTALTRLDVRADMKSMGEEEISEVIEQRALERQKKDSEPPSGKLGLALRFKAWPQVAALAIIVAGVVAALYLKTR